MRDSTFESKAYGKRVNKVISIEGRVQFDLLPVSVHVIVCMVMFPGLFVCILRMCDRIRKNQSCSHQTEIHFMYKYNIITTYACMLNAH